MPSAIGSTGPEDKSVRIFPESAVSVNGATCWRPFFFRVPASRGILNLIALNLMTASPKRGGIRPSALSLMPSGLEQTMRETQLADLIAYLRGLK